MTTLYPVLLPHAEVSTEFQAQTPAAAAQRWPLLLTARQAAERIGCCRTTFYTSGYADAIPCVIIGRSRRWRTTDVEQFVNEQRSSKSQTRGQKHAAQMRTTRARR